MKSLEASAIAYQSLQNEEVLQVYWNHHCPELLKPSEGEFFQYIEMYKVSGFFQVFSKTMISLWQRNPLKWPK